MSEKNLYLETLKKSLEDAHANEITVIEVGAHTTVTDYMVICSGRSSRHVKAIADQIMVQMKEAGMPALGSHGLEAGDWALVDFGDFVVHIMQPDSRAFYNLEGLWQEHP